MPFEPYFPGDPRYEVATADPFQEYPDLGWIYNEVSLSCPEVDIRLDLSEGGTLTIWRPKQSVHIEVTRDGSAFCVAVCEARAADKIPTGPALWETRVWDREEAARIIANSSICYDI